MKESKHTPGTWAFSLQDPQDNYAVILNADEMPKGRTARLLTEIAKVNMTIDSGEANAALIAKAPEMAAEIKKLEAVADTAKDIIRDYDVGPGKKDNPVVTIFIRKSTLRRFQDALQAAGF